MSARLYIGTSGWSYPAGEGTWKGHFYPAGIRNELAYYSEFFNAVEINSSFYAPLNSAYALGWVRRTPPDFRFTAKLWQKFTHPAMYSEAAGEAATISAHDVELFKKGIEPLAASGKLGALLVQFPHGFVDSGTNRRTIKAIINTFRDYPLAFELRHKSWSDNPATAAMFHEAGVAWVSIDEPVFASSIASDLPLTCGMAYFRFHGRNYENWWSGDNETRYKYVYSDGEIAGLAKRAKQAAEKTNVLYAFFNNHYQGYAPRNASQLRMALEAKE